MDMANIMNADVGGSTKKKKTETAQSNLNTLGNMLKNAVTQTLKSANTGSSNTSNINHVNAPNWLSSASKSASTPTSTGSTGTKSSTTSTSTATTNTPTTATTARGVTYDPTTTTASAADLKQIEGTMPTYTQSQALTDALNKLHTYQANKPGDYESPYSTQIEELYNKVTNPEKFTYDPNADPLYQMYADRYNQSAKQSMQDTMAEAASLTGGYGNSYATAAAQQAYDSQMQGLNDALPTLYNQAYGEYTDRQNQLLNQLQTAQSMDETAYSRHRDDVSDYYTGLDALTNAANTLYNREYGEYSDALQQANTDRDYYLSKAATEVLPSTSSGGGSGRSSSGGSTSGTSKDYKTILSTAKGMEAQAAYDYVARMANQGYITNEEADKILSVNLGLDVAALSKGSTTGSGASSLLNSLANAAQSLASKSSTNSSGTNSTKTNSSKTNSSSNKTSSNDSTSSTATGGVAWTVKDILNKYLK